HTHTQSHTATHTLTHTHKDTHARSVSLSLSLTHIHTHSHIQHSHKHTHRHKHTPHKCACCCFPVVVFPLQAAVLFHLPFPSVVHMICVRRRVVCVLCVCCCRGDKECRWRQNVCVCVVCGLWCVVCGVWCVCVVCGVCACVSVSV